MAQSKLEVYLHFVWATKGREASIPPEWERDMYRIIEAEVQKQKGTVIAIGGVDNHVHLLIRYSRTVTLARLMNQVKGVSSSFLNSKRGDEESIFRWQPGYGVFSLGRNQVARAAKYVHNQKEHHAANFVWLEWETVPEDENDNESGDFVEA